MNRIKWLAMAAFVASFILSDLNCSKNTVNSNDPVTIDNPGVSTQTQGAITIEKYNADRDTTPNVSSTDIASLSDGNSAFAMDMYKKITGATDNVFFSPYSISIALAMTWGGARNKTERDMASVLHFPFPQAQLHSAFNALDLALVRHARTSGFELHVVNQLWGEKTCTFLPDYLKMATVDYGASMRLLDFIGNPEPSRVVINTWVADSTNQRITDLIPAGIIDAITRLVLTNAIYFKAQWADTFISSDTRDNIFYRSDADSLSTKFMQREGDYTYDSTADYQAVELPYKGEATSMLIVLPAPGKMAQVEASLSTGFLTSLCASLHSVRVSICLPKFKFTTKSVSLSGILQSLGMAVAFGNNADFSGIDGTGNLYIGDVFHKAFVQVDENGTEAAAATAVIIKYRSSAIKKPLPVFIANRPFIFLIRDVQTNAVLFMGKLNDPTRE
jgi:serpin B